MEGGAHDLGSSQRAGEPAQIGKMGVFALGDRRDEVELGPALGALL